MAILGNRRGLVWYVASLLTTKSPFAVLSTANNTKKDMTEPPNLLLPQPIAMWRAWIREIAGDKEMDKDRVIRHIQAHVAKHMPNADAPVERWEEWLAGSYNLLAILGCMLGIDPKHTVGVDLLLRKYNSAPADHTPPPVRVPEPTQRSSGS